MSRYWSPFVHDLEPYVPGEQPKLDRLVKLNTNENPYGPSPQALAAIRAAADDSLRLYPDPEATALRTAIATRYGVAPEQVFVGNGSDEVLAHIFMALFRQPRPLLFPDISYSFYRVYCGLYGIDFETVPLADDFGIRLDDYRRPNGGIIFPNPNAPTGMALPLADIARLLDANPDSVVVIDEAYVDFGAESATALVGRYPNLLVVHTLSKSRALAGLRVGFAIGAAPLIEGLRRVKDSFNSYPLDRLALAGAVASIEDEDWFRATCARVMASREAVREALQARDFRVLPSAANFLFAKHARLPGATLAAALRRHGVIVRHFARPERIGDWLRITIGTEEQNRALLDALDLELAH